MTTIASILEAIEQHDPSGSDLVTIHEHSNIAQLNDKDWRIVRAHKDGSKEVINTLSLGEKHMFLSWVLMSEKENKDV